MFGKQQPAISQNVSSGSDTSVGGFLLYAEAERNFGAESLNKYSTTLRQLASSLDGRDLWSIERADIYRIKSRFVRERLSDTWYATTVRILKTYLTYARDIERKTVTLDPEEITAPKRKHREVVFLTSDEVERLTGAVKLKNADGSAYLAGHRTRALLEMLLGSGLRISELLNIDREQIDRKTRETKIVGKGGKERYAFFSERAHTWLDQYLALRDDACPALFTDLFGRNRMKRADVWRFFTPLRIRAGIDKKVTPHILRHTAATQLLFNGCPVGHIKEILGHARLETTCRYYLGVDHRAAKQAHDQFLRYTTSE